MDKNNNDKTVSSKKIDEVKKASEARARENFKSEIAENVKKQVTELASEFDVKLSQKLKEGTVDEKQFKTMQETLEKSLQDVQKMMIEIKSRAQSEVNLDKLVSKLRKEAEASDGASGSDFSRAKNKNTGTRLKYEATKQKQNNEEKEADLVKYNRKTGESRIIWVTRVLSENGIPGKPLRETIMNINTKVNEDFETLGVKPRRMSLEPNPIIQFMTCHYYQTGICNQVPINGTHKDRNSSKRAYVHSCAICVRFLKGKEFREEVGSM